MYETISFCHSIAICWNPLLYMEDTGCCAYTKINQASVRMLAAHFVGFFFVGANNKKIPLIYKDNPIPTREIKLHKIALGQHKWVTALISATLIPPNILKITSSLNSLSQIQNSTREKLRPG